KMLSWIQDLFRYIQMRSWSYRIQCKSTMFLRLSTGEWSSMNKSSKVYLPFAIDDTHRPSDIQLAILDKEFYDVIAKSKGALLFLMNDLGIQSLGDDDVVDESIRLH